MYRHINTTEMTMKDRWTKRRELQELLGARTSCRVQHTGWPCNTCFHDLALPDVSDDDLHGLWHATLLLRGDYRNGEDTIHLADADLNRRIDRLLTALRPIVH